MLAWRSSFIVKQGRMKEAVELLSAEIRRAKGADSVMRIYAPDISPNVLVFEDAFETVEAHDRLWQAYWKDPDRAEYLEKWDQVVERWVATERYELYEWR